VNEICGLMTSGNTGDLGWNLNEIHGQSFDKLQGYPTRGKRRNFAKLQEHPFEANDVKLSLDKKTVNCRDRLSFTFQTCTVASLVPINSCDSIMYGWATRTVLHVSKFSRKSWIPGTPLPFF